MTLFDSGIRPAIDKWLLDKSKEVRDYGDYWSASSAGYCMRKNIFERLHVPHVEKEDDARKQRIFTAGHTFHDWIQSITKQAGLSIAQELELIDDGLMVKGHIDDLIMMRYNENGETPVKVGEEQRSQHLILYDYKTRNSKNFDYSKTMGYFHKMQLGTYLYMLRAGEHQVEEARILNIEKDNLRMSETQLMWSEELEKEIMDYWTTLNRYWNDRELPPCTCADHDGGFMAKEKWNPFFYNGEPCSIEWYRKFKKEEKGGERSNTSS